MGRKKVYYASDLDIKKPRQKNVSEKYFHTLKEAYPERKAFFENTICDRHVNRGSNNIDLGLDEKTNDRAIKDRYDSDLNRP